MKYLIVLLGFVLICLPDNVWAEGVQARYLENSGKRTVLELRVENPPPSSIIVQQQLPPGAQISSASPAYIKLNGAKTQAKWLFKRPSAGVKLITLHYTQPLTGRGATAVIRCKKPSDGQLMTITVP